MQSLLLLLLAAFHAASMATAAAPFNHSIYNMAALKEYLLTGYDIQDPPIKDGRPVNVSIGFNFHKVKSISIDSGLMEVNAWLRMEWYDQRLTWSLQDYPVTVLPLFAHQGNIADTQIWIPDAELYNGAESLVETPALALLVYNDGRVYFSRPHVYKINCSFKGATYFPYSPIFCGIDIGGWGQSGIYVNYDDGLGFTVGEDEVDSEFKFVSKQITSEVQQNYFPCCPEEPWPLVTFKVALKSQSFIHTKSLVLTNLALVYLSFALFWLDLRLGIDLIALGATYVLSLVAVDFVSSDLVPISSDLLWIEEFLAYSLASCIACLMFLSVSVYYDMVFSIEMERFGKDMKKKRRERGLLISEKVRNSWAFSKNFRYHFMLFMIPGGLINENLEEFGFHHWGDLIIYVAGYVIPMLYGSIIIRLGSTLSNQDNESFEEGEHLGQILMCVGIITVVTATFSQICEITSRLDKYNPKVVVTEQDTFVKRQSKKKQSDVDIYVEEEEEDDDY